jgi:hypothetical protein
VSLDLRLELAPLDFHNFDSRVEPRHLYARHLARGIIRSERRVARFAEFAMRPHEAPHLRIATVKKKKIAGERHDARRCPYCRHHDGRLAPSGWSSTNDAGAQCFAHAGTQVPGFGCARQRSLNARSWHQSNHAQGCRGGFT